MLTSLVWEILIQRYRFFITITSIINNKYNKKCTKFLRLTNEVIIVSTKKECSQEMKYIAEAEFSIKYFARHVVKDNVRI